MADEAARERLPADEVHYVALGGARERIAAGLSGPGAPLGRVLDVGTGDGLFALALAEAEAAESVLGIDPHEGCIAVARLLARHRGLDARCRFEPLALEAVSGRFDTISSFLALSDLLRRVDLDGLLLRLRDRLAENGRLVIADAFPERAADASERLGFALHRAMGYVYPSLGQLLEALDRAGFRLHEQEAYETQSPLVGPREMAEFLLREDGYNQDRGDSGLAPDAAWESVREEVLAARGVVRFDARIELVVAIPSHEPAIRRPE